MAILALKKLIIAGLLVAFSSDQRQASAIASTASTTRYTCFRAQTSLAMSPGGTLKQVFEFYVPCRDSFDVDENGFLVFPEA